MKENIQIYGLGLLLVIGGFLLANHFVKPSPPRSITIATGGLSGAYYAYAQAYKKLLAQKGIELNIVSTSGSIDNIERLQKSEVDLAFVQSGTGQAIKQSGSDSEHLVSLASIYYEPLWLFMPKSKKAFKTADLKGRRIAIGMEGSGTRALVSLLLENNGINASNTNLMAVNGDESARLLLNGEIDYMFVVSSMNSALIQSLLTNNDIATFDFDRAKAYTRRYRFLSSVELPQGVIDFSRNIPENDINLLSAAATLAARDDIHPALVALLMQVLEDVHGEGGILEEPGQFPSQHFVDFPLDISAKRYFDYGPPLLQRYLPFWAAVLVNQLKIFLIPLLALMIPLMKILPPIYRWRVRSRIYRWYGDLRDIEQKISDDIDKDSSIKLMAELVLLQEDVTRQPAPLSYTDELYHLRSHISLVYEKLDKKLLQNSVKA
jgi:TRAP transporter TAXI family solute receptor